MQKQNGCHKAREVRHESTEVVLALLDLIDPPPPIAGPSSRKFVIILSFGLSKAMEDIFSNFFAGLRHRVEVGHLTS